MKQLIVALAVSSFLLSACLDMDTVTVAPNPFAVTPSRPPTILTLTPILIHPTISATLSPTSSITPSLTTGSAPTTTDTFTPSPTLIGTFTPSLTITKTPQLMTIQLLGCDTGIDLTHGMGEVTNAYITLINASRLDLTSVCASLSSVDEGRIHPDKMICIPSLPDGYLVTLKLTIDTTFQVNTIVEIAVTSNEGIPVTAGGLACRDIGAFKPAPETINVLQPIP